MADQESDRALIAAVRDRDADGVGRLLATSDPNARDAESTLTALMFAAGLGATDIVDALIAAGALVNAVDDRAGATALHKACQGGHLGAVRSLVKAGAFVNQQTATTGHTPVVEAIWFKADELVRFLLDSGARVDVNTYYCFTTKQHIEYALHVNQAPAAQQALLRIRTMVEQKESAIAQEQSLQTLNAAILKNDRPAFDAALAAGANIEQRWPVAGTFEFGHTPLLIAARDGRTEMVAELIRYHANPNAVEPVFGAVPLHKATYHGYLEITKLLAGAPGVDFDYQGPSNGYTPLHDALWHGFPDCAQVLIDGGARVDIIAYDGKLPVDIAAEELPAGHPIIAELRRRLATAS